MIRTKHCQAHKWNTLEYTINQPVVAVFRSPAGAEVEIGYLLFGVKQFDLDGVNNKAVRTSWGRINLRPKQPCDVTYAWFADGKPGDIVKIPLP